MRKNHLALSKNVFNVGDIVFAKVKEYSHWPAIIVGLENLRITVRFYGTGEM